LSSYKHFVSAEKIELKKTSVTTDHIMTDNKAILISLPNYKKFESKIQIAHVSVGPEYFMEKKCDTKGPVGPMGWCGCNGSGLTAFKEPIYARKYVLMIDIPIVNENKIVTHLKSEWVKLKYGESYRINQKIIGSGTIRRPEKLVKQPWFDEVLEVIRKHAPDFTEDALIDRHLTSSGDLRCWNRSAVLKIKPEKDEEWDIIDDTTSVLVLYIMNDDIPNNLAKIDGTLGFIFS
jgi:hypothetical protein